MNSLDNKNARFIRKNNSTSDFEISYLNIDATLETNRACLELYTDSKALPNKLKSDGHNISYLIAKNDLEIEKQDVEKIDRIAKIEKIVSLLRGVQDEFDLDELASKKGFDSLQRSIINYFSSFYGYIEPNQLLDEISRVSQKRDSRELKRLILGADFVISSQDDLYKMVVNKYFKIGTKYSSKDILTKWNRVFIETSLNKKLDTPTKAVRQLKIHFVCQRKNDGTYLIVTDNPFKLTILKTKESDTKLSDKED
jgi:hypothetical protein